MFQFLVMSHRSKSLKNCPPKKKKKSIDSYRCQESILLVKDMSIQFGKSLEWGDNSVLGIGTRFFYFDITEIWLLEHVIAIHVLIVIKLLMKLNEATNEHLIETWNRVSLSRWIRWRTQCKVPWWFFIIKREWRRLSLHH